MKTRTLLLVCILVILLCTQADAKIIYVDDDASGANNGSSWQNAYKYLQDALAEANSAKEPFEIRVAQGVYQPDLGVGYTTGDIWAYFELRNNITLSGGYAGILETDPDKRDYEKYKTILSADLDGNDVDVNDPNELRSEPTRRDNSYLIIKNQVESVIDGFTISGNHGIFIPHTGGNMFG
ncbi:MAG: hypothetical protein P8016_10355 [Sedimentisphaerales bacterium]